MEKAEKIQRIIDGLVELGLLKIDETGLQLSPECEIIEMISGVKCAAAEDTRRK